MSAYWQAKYRLPVKREANQKAKIIKAVPEEQIKDPYVLEFLGLTGNPICGRAA